MSAIGRGRQEQEQLEDLRRAQVRTRLRWAGGRGLSKPELKGSLGWDVGMGAVLRELRELDEVHVRAGRWYLGPDPRPSGRSLVVLSPKPLDLEAEVLARLGSATRSPVAIGMEITGASLDQVVATVNRLVERGRLEQVGDRVRLVRTAACAPESQPAPAPEPPWGVTAPAGGPALEVEPEPEPEIEELELQLKPEPEVDLTPRLLTVLDAIKRDPTSTMAALAQSTDLSRGSCASAVHALRRKGIVLRGHPFRLADPLAVEPTAPEEGTCTSKPERRAKADGARARRPRGEETSSPSRTPSGGPALVDAGERPLGVSDPPVLEDAPSAEVEVPSSSEPARAPAAAVEDPSPAVALDSTEPPRRRSLARRVARRLVNGLRSLWGRA